MKIEITDEELNKLFKDKILEHFKKEIDDRMLGYWVRQEINKVISKEVIEEHIKKNFPNDKLTEILKDAFENYIQNKYG